MAMQDIACGGLEKDRDNPNSFYYEFNDYLDDVVEDLNGDDDLRDQIKSRILDRIDDEQENTSDSSQTIQEFAQKRINGKYCLSWGGSVCIELNKKKINWETSGDLRIISVGSGTYEIKNKKLYLNFKKDSMDYESTVELPNTAVTDKDDISLAIKGLINKIFLCLELKLV